MKKGQQDCIKNICAKLYCEDYKRFSVRLMEAVKFNNPYAVNSTFAIVSAQAGDKIVDSSLYESLDKDVKVMIDTFAEMYAKLRQGLKIDKNALSDTKSRNDVSEIEALYSKALTDSIADQVMNKVTPGLFRLFNSRYDIDDFRRFIYSKIVAGADTRWQQRINSVLGDKQFDERIAKSFLGEFILKVYEDRGFGFNQDEIMAYQDFLKSNHSFDFVDTRVQKYAEQMLERYTQVIGDSPLTRSQLNAFKTKHRGSIVNNFGTLGHLLNDEHIRYNFVRPVVDGLRRFIKDNPQSTSDLTLLKYLEHKRAIDNTSLISNNETKYISADKLQDTEIKLSTPIALNKQVSSYKSNSTMDEYMECYMANMVEQGLLPSGSFDEEYIAKHKKAFIYQLAHNMDKFGEAAVIDELRKIIDANSKER